jgi:hypothetical protein
LFHCFSIITLALRLPESRITGFAACPPPVPEAATPCYELLPNGLALKSGWTAFGGHDPEPFFNALDGQQLSVVKLSFWPTEKLLRPHSAKLDSMATVSP